jgi:hypothetical protein
MPRTINAFKHEEWARQGLKDYGDFADHKRMLSAAKRLCRPHGDFAWWHFCRDEAVVILGVS